MNNNLIVGVGFFEGRSYIIGRKGHIYINDRFASRLHAEIKITDGKIFLRDLGSSNGTYLVCENRLKRFREGYVKMLQPIVIARLKYTARDLLAIASPSDFSMVSV